MTEKKEKNTARIELRLNPSLLVKLQQHIDTNDINISQLLRKLLNNYLN
jgi:predicted DNA binding CopG/RHH family protein